VGKDDYLLTENTVLVNDKKNKTEAVTNLIYQKTNGKLFGFPLRLHIYNLARPDIDSILQSKIYDNPRKVEWKTKVLSRKQLDKDIESRKNFNAWLKKTGEAPVLIDELKTQKTTTQLQKYFFSIGWFDVKTSYEINKNENQRAQITYNVITGDPYILDSINPIISTPIIDSLYSQKLYKNSFLKKGEQYNESNFEKERERLTSQLRNSGFYHFGQDYISFEIDTVNTNKKINTDLIIKNRSIRTEDSIYRRPFKVYKIKEVNVYTDNAFENQNSTIKDSVVFNNYNLYSYDKLKYRPKALTDAIFITKGQLFKDIDRARTYRYLSELRTFKYPNIEYIENTNDTTLTANIYLLPKKKYELSFNPEISQSNIQTIGLSFSSGLVIRNIFKGAETFEISAIGSIGSSKDASNTKDQFFDINEVGANLKLTIPRLFFPINTEKIIPKFMSPSTRLSLSTTSQRNIGLDKQTLSGIFNYNWYPTNKVTNNVDLFNIQFVKNLNTDNYFGVYQTSYSRLNDIARSIDYIGNDESLSIPDGTDQFIDDVLNDNTSLTPNDDDYVDVSNIDQRKQRLTENNLIFSTSFNYTKDRRENIFDNDFSILRFRLEVAGNLISGISNLTGAPKNENNQYEVFGVAFSQYAKAEFDYVKHWDLGKKNVLAVRSYMGIAIPYGNSNSIPFSKSFFAGGPNDNRAWTAYNLGPGSSKSINEFNEANFKLQFSAEQRFNILGSLYGALFVDAGNIWNVLDDIEDESSTFNGFSSLKDIAVGSGFGIRYDFNFFVLRGDIGFKTYDPSFDLGERWFKNYNFAGAVYNIGINYPF
jgi:outer membrane protein assembly factor BamA